MKQAMGRSTTQEQGLTAAPFFCFEECVDCVKGLTT